MGPIIKKLRSNKGIPPNHEIGSLPRNMEKALSYGVKACDEGDIFQVGFEL